MGDDWFHNGAFRQQNMPYIHDQEADAASRTTKWWTEPLRRLRHVHAGGLGGRTRPAPRPRADRLLAEDARAPGLRRVLARPGGGQDARRAAAQGAGDAGAQPLGPGGHLRRHRRLQGASSRRTRPTTRSSWCSGPWHHGQEIGDGSSLGAIKFDSDTGAVLPPRDPRVRSSTNTSRTARRRRTSPRSRRSRPAPTRGGGCRVARRLRERLHGQADAALPRCRPASRASTAPQAGDAAFDEYISDPAKPVPFRARPIQPVGYDDGLTWAQWLVDDQREASGRPDVAGLHLRCR